MEYEEHGIPGSKKSFSRTTTNTILHIILRKVWRYQRDNQNPYIEEEQTTQWPKEKVQKDKQRSTKHTYKTKDRVIRTPLKTGGELRWPGRVGSSCSTSGTRRVNLVTNLPFVCIMFPLYHLYWYIIIITPVLHLFIIFRWRYTMY